MKSKFILLFLLLTTYLSQAQMRYFYANLQGSQEVPATASTATGVVVLTYNTVNKTLQVIGDFQNLAAAAGAGHIHGPGAAGVNAPVLFTLVVTPSTTGTITSASPITLTDVQQADLYAGNFYINVHNTSFPGGEIRGQITATSTTSTDFFNGRLQGSQEVPPNASTATGTFALLLDKTTSMVYATGNFTGLAANATASHIHVGAANTNGPVRINFVVTPSTAGTIHVISAIAAADLTELSNGNAYVNIHNSTFTGGEIRGQISMLSQADFFKTVLSGSNEVPATPSAAKGVIIVKYNRQTKFLELVGDYQGLVAAATAGHIHGPAAAGSNAPVLYSMTVSGGTFGTISGSATLTAAQETDLLAGNMYVNVHNAIYPGGEIRGQLSATTAGETQYLTGDLQGAQENPATGSTGSGKVTVILDKVTREVYVTGSFTGLAANASAGHLHRGPAGVNGPVILGLSAAPTTSGPISGSGVVSQGFADSIIAGLAYANVHNSSFPGGELRAQLGNQVLPVKLSYFNGYKERNNINLVWQSAQEVELKQYEVEQQHPATKQWLTKGIVKAIGSSIRQDYRMVDAPITGIDNFVFYRLKAVDKNGSFSYSPTVRINFKQASASLNILSNPVTKGMLRYNISGLTTDKKVEVSIIDFNGRLMYKTIQSGLSTNDINVSLLGAGMYKLLIKSEDVQLQQSFLK